MIREIKEKFIKIISFFENYFEDEYYIDENGDIFLTANFISEYDGWAYKRGYKRLKYLSTLANLQSYLLEKDIRVKSMKFVDNESVQIRHTRALKFYLKDIIKATHE